MIPASAVIAGQNMSTSSALGPGSSVLARVPVTSMSFVAVRTLSQDNRVETQSQVPDRRDTPQQAIHVLNALLRTAAMSRRISRRAISLISIAPQIIRRYPDVAILRSLYAVFDWPNPTNSDTSREIRTVLWACQRPRTTRRLHSVCWNWQP
jgi:hypothetical protein